MKRTVASVLLVAAVLAAVIFCIIERNRLASEIAAQTDPPIVTLPTKKADDRYHAGPRNTEAANYGEGRTADLLELMKNITGRKYYIAAAYIEDFFEQRFEKSSYALITDHQVYEKGEDQHHYFNSMNVSSEGLTFDRFIFIANQEYGNVYKLEFESSSNVSGYTVDEMREYFSRLEKELTECLGKPSDQRPLSDEKPERAFAEYKINEECTFLLEYYPYGGGNGSIKLCCTNNIERKHFLIGGEADDADAENNKDKENYYKSPGPDDVVKDPESGFVYVKNQLLVSFSAGTPNAREKMEKVCAELGAKIVGHIELTSDFQIEFDRDVSCKELLQIAEELKEKYYFVSGAYLNTVTEGDPLD